MDDVVAGAVGHEDREMREAVRIQTVCLDDVFVGTDDAVVRVLRAPRTLWTPRRPPNTHATPTHSGRCWQISEHSTNDTHGNSNTSHTAADRHDDEAVSSSS